MAGLNGLSLFSGIGGIDLAFTWAGGHILAFCEIDNYCQKVFTQALARRADILRHTRNQQGGDRKCRNIPDN